jgi:hypothetical protein
LKIHGLFEHVCEMSRCFPPTGEILKISGLPM